MTDEERIKELILQLHRTERAYIQMAIQCARYKDEVAVLEARIVELCKPLEIESS
jgi:hypothetical protein